MHNIKHKGKWIIASILVVLLMAVVCGPLESKADFGNFAGDNDYGGGFGGGDYGDDDSGFLTLLFYLIFSALPLPVKLIIIAIIIVAYFVNKITNRGRRATRKPEYVSSPAATVALLPITSYTALDPHFDEAAMTEKLSNLYVQMQDAWCKKDITSLRPYFTDAQYTQYDRQLQEAIRDHVTNHVERIAVLSVVLKGYYQSGGKDHLVAELQTRITTYTTDDMTGKVVHGSKTAEKFMTYEWDLVRPSGMTTREEGAMTSIACPHCGAPLDINHSAKCPYCDSVVTLEEHDFVIYSIKGIAQQTIG